MTDFSNIIKKAKKLPKSKPKKKVKTVTQLKKELWKVFSLYIRNRDNWTCFTCGAKATGQGMHAGHYITGATCKLPLYFHELNVHAQCYYCNIHLSGNWPKYHDKMIALYGPDIKERLEKENLWNGSGKDFDFEERIVHYTK